MFYRAGQFQAAIEQLEKANKLMPRHNPAGKFLLAMAHHQLKHADEAQKWLKRAVEEMEADAGLDQRFRRGLGWGSVRPLAGGLGGRNDDQSPVAPSEARNHPREPTENEWIGRCM